MRLWHKDLIPVLPRQQLIGQWRECCLIAKQISEKGTPNHILVNKIMDILGQGKCMINEREFREFGFDLGLGARYTGGGEDYEVANYFCSFIRRNCI